MNFEGLSMDFGRISNGRWTGLQSIFQCLPNGTWMVFTVFAMELDGFAMHFQWNLEGFPMHFQWILGGRSIDCQWMSNGFWKCSRGFCLDFQRILVRYSMPVGWNVP